MLKFVGKRWPVVATLGRQFGALFILLLEVRQVHGQLVTGDVEHVGPDVVF